jgi:ABC-2 type transport system permease protein
VSLLVAERRRFFKRRLTRWALVAIALVLAVIATVIAVHTRSAERFVFRDEFEPLIHVLTGLMGLFGFVVGASYVGAEWSSGAMVNLLAWRPRRMSVLLAKLATALAAVLGTTLLLGAGWTAALWAIACRHGDDSGMTRGAWASVALTGTRAVVLVLALTAVGFALASLGRHTAVALAVALAVAIVGEVGVRTLLDLVNVPFYERYLLSTYGAAWLTQRWHIGESGPCQGTCAEIVVTWQQAALVLGALVTVALGAALWSVRRRDVT